MGHNKTVMGHSKTVLGYSKTVMGHNSKLVLFQSIAKGSRVPLWAITRLLWAIARLLWAITAGSYCFKALPRVPGCCYGP